MGFRVRARARVRVRVRVRVRWLKASYRRGLLWLQAWATMVAGLQHVEAQHAHRVADERPSQPVRWSQG